LRVAIDADVVVLLHGPIVAGCEPG
jgi:hypothetical protein